MLIQDPTREPSNVRDHTNTIGPRTGEGRSRADRKRGRSNAHSRAGREAGGRRATRGCPRSGSPAAAALATRRQVGLPSRSDMAGTGGGARSRLLMQPRMRTRGRRSAATVGRER